MQKLLVFFVGLASSLAADTPTSSFGPIRCEASETPSNASFPPSVFSESLPLGDEETFADGKAARPLRFGGVAASFLRTKAGASRGRQVARLFGQAESRPRAGSSGKGQRVSRAAAGPPPRRQQAQRPLSPRGLSALAGTGSPQSPRSAAARAQQQLQQGLGARLFGPQPSQALRVSAAAAGRPAQWARTPSALGSPLSTQVAAARLSPQLQPLMAPRPPGLQVERQGIHYGPQEPQRPQGPSLQGPPLQGPRALPPREAPEEGGALQRSESRQEINELMNLVLSGESFSKAFRSLEARAVLYSKLREAATHLRPPRGAEAAEAALRTAVGKSAAERGGGRILSVEEVSVPDSTAVSFRSVQLELLRFIGARAAPPPPGSRMQQAGWISFSVRVSSPVHKRFFGKEPLVLSTPYAKLGEGEGPTRFGVSSFPTEEAAPLSSPKVAEAAEAAKAEVQRVLRLVDLFQSESQGEAESPLSSSSGVLVPGFQVRFSGGAEKGLAEQLQVVGRKVFVNEAFLSEAALCSVAELLSWNEGSLSFRRLSRGTSEAGEVRQGEAATSAGALEMPRRVRELVILQMLRGLASLHSAGLSVRADGEDAAASLLEKLLVLKQGRVALGFLHVVTPESMRKCEEKPLPAAPLAEAAAGGEASPSEKALSEVPCLKGATSSPQIEDNCAAAAAVIEALLEAPDGEGSNAALWKKAAERLRRPTSADEDFSHTAQKTLLWMLRNLAVEED